MTKKDEMIEIFSNPDGRIAYKILSTEKLITEKVFELEPTETEVINPEEYVSITEGMWIVMPVGGGESWTVDILVNENGDFVIFVQMGDEYIKAEKIPVSPVYLKEHNFESKGKVNLSEKILEAGIKKQKSAAIKIFMDYKLLDKMSSTELEQFADSLFPKLETKISNKVNIMIIFGGRYIDSVDYPKGEWYRTCEEFSNDFRMTWKITHTSRQEFEIDGYFEYEASGEIKQIVKASLLRWSKFLKHIKDFTVVANVNEPEILWL